MTCLRTAARHRGLASIGAVVALLFRVSQYLKRFSNFGTLSQMIPTIQDVHRFRQLFLREQSPNVDMVVDPGLAPGELVIEGVTYRYRGSSTAALDHVTNHIVPGEFIGVVGSSGSGKSTLVRAIVGLLEPQEGEVRVGLTGHRERGRPIAYVPQSPFILRGTIASNVRWFRERQRVAVARALAADPRIFVLDEATSARDSESEAAIQRALDQLRGNITIIAVAHRLSTVLSADRIGVLEAGTITEDAPAQEQLRTKGSRFAQLGALQGLISDG